tara:strand:+ start:8183 stop:8797 length:615 start_codon:yes stop_codon:yes gene_type:complete
MSDNFFPVRAVHPVRSKVVEQNRYTLYRNDLRKDFANSCGYCGDDDLRVDRIAFHIDHFAPKRRFPDLELDYNNLVYSCRFCNVSKSDHWIGEDASKANDGERGFIDPCSEDYEAHLRREPYGRIVGETPLGRYIVRRLKLNLLRHELLWQARRARNLRDEVHKLKEKLNDDGKRHTSAYLNLAEHFITLTLAIEDYELRANNK